MAYQEAPNGEQLSDHASPRPASSAITTNGHPERVEAPSGNDALEANTVHEGTNTSNGANHIVGGLISDHAAHASPIDDHLVSKDAAIEAQISEASVALNGTDDSEIIIGNEALLMTDPLLAPEGSRNIVHGPVPEAANTPNGENGAGNAVLESVSAPNGLNGDHTLQESNPTAIATETVNLANGNVAEISKPSDAVTANGTSTPLKTQAPPGKKLPPPPTPLKVIIVGAGISGLTAATSLRHAGHDVKLFEQSGFSNEIGAAIHLGPNATRLLSKLNYDPKRLRGSHCRGFSMYDSSGRIVMEILHDNIEKAYKSPWYLVHRVDLHNELKRLALDAEGPGKPAELFLESTVIQVDVESGTITLQNGETHQGDLVIAADGIHSQIREMLFDPAKPNPTGTAAYRFVVDSDAICGVPDCLPMEKEDGRCRVIFDGGKRVVIYPCRDNTLMNFVCMHPSEVQGETSEGWNSTATADQVVETFKDFSPLVQTMLKKATNVKCWQLLERKVLPSWVKGRVCLIGDSAHPMLPHQGQGGGQAMEDGASLGPLFTFGTKRDNVSDVLQLYEQVRYSRANKIQWLSETQYVGKDGLDREVTQKWTFEHDVTEFARLTRSSQLIL